MRPPSQMAVRYLCILRCCIRAAFVWFISVVTVIVLWAALTVIVSHDNHSIVVRLGNS